MATIGPRRSYETVFAEGVAPPLPGRSTRVTEGSKSFALELGVDVGYQLTFGRLYLAPMAGVSAGYCFNALQAVRPLAYAFMASGETSNRPVVGFNLNLVRVGFTL